MYEDNTEQDTTETKRVQSLKHFELLLSWDLESRYLVLSTQVSTL